MRRPRNLSVVAGKELAGLALDDAGEEVGVLVGDLLKERPHVRAGAAGPWAHVALARLELQANLVHRRK